jgi:hypothetical protein
MYQHRPLQDPLKFTQIGNFGLKTNHLATLRKIPSLRARTLPLHEVDDFVKLYSGRNVFWQILIQHLFMGKI